MLLPPQEKRIDPDHEERECPGPDMKFFRILAVDSAVCRWRVGKPDVAGFRLDQGVLLAQVAFEDSDEMSQAGGPDFPETHQFPGGNQSHDSHYEKRRWGHKQAEHLR